MAKFSKDESTLFVTRGKTFYLYALEKRSVQADFGEIDDRRHTALSMWVSANNTFVATGSADGKIFLWMAKEFYPVKEFSGHTSAVWSVILHPDGHHLISGAADTSIKVWHIETGQVIHEMRHNNVVRSLALSPDGERLASASFDMTARVWLWRNGSEIFTLYGHMAAVWAITFSPNGETIFTGSHDGSIRAWDAHTGDLRYSVDVKKPQASLAVSPDSTTILAGSMDGMVSFWKHPTGAPITSFAAHESAVLSVAYAPSGTQYATCGQDGWVRTWTTAAYDCQLLEWSAWDSCLCANSTQRRSQVLSRPLPAEPHPCDLQHEQRACTCRDPFHMVYIVGCCFGSVILILVFLMLLQIFWGKCRGRGAAKTLHLPHSSAT